MALRQMRRRKAVLDTFQFSNSTLYQRIAEGTFPPPVKLGPQISAWFDDELEAFQRGEWHQGWKPQDAAPTATINATCAATAGHRYRALR
jgi:predicted DNA-binding transcriptional regulator AlpA